MERKKRQRATQSDIPRRFLSAGGILVRRGSALDNAIAQQRQENDRLRSEILWVNEAIQRRGLVASRPGTKTDPALIQHSAQQAGLNISVVTSTPDHFAISLPVVKNEPLFAWLNTLQNEGIQVSQLTFSARPVAGEIAVEALELYPVGK